MSAGVAKALVSRAEPRAAQLLIWLMLHSGAELNMTEEEVLSLAEALQRLGAITPFAPPAPADELPEYDASELAARSRSDPSFAAVVEETQRALGKMLSGGEVRTLFGIYDFLGLPADVILLLVNYCVDRTREKGGPGRVPGMRYIEKEAYSWVNREILTLDRAEEYLRAKEQGRAAREQLRRMLGIAERNLSPTERKYIDRWAEMGFGPGVAELAYDKTVVNTGALKWAYMDKILASWHEKGLHTLEEIGAGDRRLSRDEASGPSVSDKGEMERMKRMLDRMKRSERG